MRALALAALLAAGVLVAVVVWRHDSDTRLEVVFEQAAGLVEGAEVRSGGIRVGSVESLALGSDGLPHATLRLRDGYRARRGVVADLRLGSLSGEVNRFVDLRGGSGARLRDGAVLGVRATDQPVEIDQVLSTLDPATRGEVRGVLAGLRGALDGRGDDGARALAVSAPALREAASALEDLTADGAALRSLVRSTARVTRALAASPGATGGAVERLSAALGDLAAERSALALALQRLPAGLREPRLALAGLRGAVPDLRALVRSLTPATAELAPAARELRALLRDGRPALREARSLVVSAPADARALRPLVASARPLARRLDSTLAQANPMLDEIRVRLPDAFSFFSGWADFTSNFDANGHAARVGLVLPPAPLNTIGGDSGAAGHLRAPFLRTPGVLEGEPWRGYKDSFVGSGG